MHYYKFNISDWGLSTAHLSLEEEAIYFRLINHYYDTESPIPLETQSVYRRLRMGSHIELADIILGEFFEQTDKGWVHSRCEKVLKDYRKTSKKNKLNGSKGGRPSKNAAPSVSQKKPNGLPTESQNNPNQELLTKNHKPLTKEIVIPDGINQPAWNEWIEYRKSKKKTVSAIAAKKQFKLLSNYAFEVQQVIIDQSIQNDYQGLFEPKGNSNGGLNQSGQHTGTNRKLTPTERVQAKRAEARRRGGLECVGNDDQTLPPRMDEQRGGGADRTLGETLDGTYHRTD